ncbi:sulfotransferase family protein [Frateuria hangzhouensis]|uniref:sulfotransferase family protein n=1 Tax=Frateuria hangzhouensis TaxID=2995589 RepID=UPI002260B11B|nr:sulfotransferase [Frateuria sp. STR12]MCX7513943.1 sulfotransferase [Frateuria sp. STR12]
MTYFQGAARCMPTAHAPTASDDGLPAGASAIALDPPPIFLLGSHKSGSSLLRSLLDGHPSLAVLPKETHLFQFTNHWVDYRRRRNLPRAMDRSEFFDQLLGQIREDTRGHDPYADAPGFSYRMEILEPRLRALDPADMPAFLLGYMQAAYEASFGQPPAAGRALVEKSVEHAEFAYVLARYFPGARFVHIVRNPYATLVALRRMLQKMAGRFPYLWPVASSLHNSYHQLFTNRLALPNYLCVRFEDLVSDTAATMRDVAGFLGIDYDEALVHPTSQGEHWQGNSTSNEAFGGISQRPLEAWKSQITDYEIALANLVAAPVLDAFGYERLEPRHPNRWIRGERPRAYAVNRLALWLGP